MIQPANLKTGSLRHFAAWLAALFLVVLGAKLWVVQLFGSPLPLWDQWYEAGSFFAPWMEGHLAWKDFFAPDNEHRIFFTRLLDMTVISLNGRWEPLLQMTVNAFIHAAFVCALAFCLWDFLGRKNGWLVCFLLAPFYALPYAGENTIWAINSQQYFMSLCALATLAGLGFGKTGGARWWLGLAAAFAGLFTMASGFLASMAVAGLMILRSIKIRRVEKENLLTFILCLVIIALGASLNVTMPDDLPLRAHTPAEFISAFVRNLAWPFIENSGLMCLVMLLPLALLAVFYFRKNFPEPRAAEFLLGLGLWSALQSAAIAFGRANYGDGFPASRYMDVLNVFVIAGIFAVVLFAQSWTGGGISRPLAPLLPLVFAGVIFFSLGKISQIVVKQLLIPTRMMNLVAEERVETFMATGDQRELFEPPTVRPDPKLVLGILSNKKLQAIMPAACLPPADHPAKGRLAAAADWLLRISPAILICGLALFAGLCGLGLARKIPDLAGADLTGTLVLLAALTALGFVWSKSPIQRNTIERELHQKLAAYFTSVGNPVRAAIHEHKAEALKN